MVPKTGELHRHAFLKRISSLFMSISKICNDGPSYRVGEAPRATPFGLARLPNIDLSVMYQLYLPKDDISNYYVVFFKLTMMTNSSRYKEKLLIKHHVL